MAFGTGRHESTKIMIKLMDAVNFTGKTVLDIGCGSGILALNAYLLGAKKIFAVDNDLDAVLNAKKNVSLNEANTINLACASLRIFMEYMILFLQTSISRRFQSTQRLLQILLRKTGISSYQGS